MRLWNWGISRKPCWIQMIWVRLMIILNVTLISRQTDWQLLELYFIGNARTIWRKDIYFNSNFLACLCLGIDSHDFHRRIYFTWYITHPNWCSNLVSHRCFDEKFYPLYEYHSKHDKSIVEIRAHSTVYRLVCFRIFLGHIQVVYIPQNEWIRNWDWLA